ncbi:hypothetical protein BCR44DRAFT_1429202 [Catenaria anguillulae PL171]|uniref:Uncharacterized protein n=1 Tax=Catenaria anguillulae PL171 TaxID=765915 RepID=A0A1Y2HZ27_9FUNG|nr:hypothetical protein BCR44DRAFT_1429202 [Catenaria anguillulae PL171]
MNKSEYNTLSNRFSIPKQAQVVCCPAACHVRHDGCGCRGIADHSLGEAQNPFCPPGTCPVLPTTHLQGYRHRQRALAVRISFLQGCIHKPRRSGLGHQQVANVYPRQILARP